MPPVKITPATRLYALFGGSNALADAIGVDRAVTSRWNSDGKRGNHGNIPPQYNVAILQAADALGINMKRVADCLDDHICPVCMRPMEPGQRARPEYFDLIKSLSEKVAKP